ncbi:hypothetical protein [Streptomyces tsukubensis]|uniref:hypothetical protein n=1 Tax=Streptomyces tsukubensis TaxID=83656 RepID=UPI00345005F4
MRPGNGWDDESDGSDGASRRPERGREGAREGDPGPYGTDGDGWFASGTGDGPRPGAGPEGSARYDGTGPGPGILPVPTRAPGRRRRPESATGTGPESGSWSSPGDGTGDGTGDGAWPDSPRAPGRRRRPGPPPGDGEVSGTPGPPAPGYGTGAGAGDLPGTTPMPGPGARPEFGSGPAAAYGTGDGTPAAGPFTPVAGPRRSRRADRFGAGTGEVPVPPPYQPPAPPGSPPPVSPPPEATVRSLPRESPAVRFGPVAAGLVALLATFLPDGNPLRWLPVVLFLVAGPGIAVLRVCEPRLRRDSAVGPEDDWEHGFGRDSDRLELLMLAVFLSVSLVVLGATALIALKFFSGTGLLLLLTGTTAVASACPRLPEGRHRYENPATPPQEG